VAEEDGGATYNYGQVHSDYRIRFCTQCCLVASTSCSFSFFGIDISTVLHISVLLGLFNVAFCT